MFSPGIYNQQRSQYVGNTLGEMMQLLPIAQQRYDESREMFNDMDALVENLPHMEGDREALTQLASPFREAINRARETGDYRGLYDEASQLTKKLHNDRGLAAIKQSYDNMMAQKEMEMKLGTSAISFSKPEGHKTITYDENGKPQYNIFVPMVEQRKDYDDRISKIWSILKADGMPINLADHKGDIQGFLEYGKWTGISDTKVKNYVQQAFDRYLSTPEGEQDWRRLTKAEGMDPVTAAQDIQKRLLAVGSGMVYSDTDKRYMENPAIQAAEAAKQTELMNSLLGNMAASKSNQLTLENIFGGGEMKLDEKGEIVNSFDWGSKFDANQAINKSVMLDPILATIKSFAETVWAWGKDENNKINLTPERKTAMENVKNIIASQKGVSPSEVKNQDFVDYYNQKKREPINFTPPVKLLDGKTMDMLGDLFQSKPVETADGKKLFQPKALTGQTLYYNGNRESWESLFGENGKISGKDQEPAAVSITRSFGVNNPFGFASGGVVLEVMTPKGQIEIPMEIKRNDLSMEAVVENGLHQVDYNPLTYSSPKPVDYMGRKFVFSGNPNTGEYTMEDVATGKKVSASFNEDFSKYASKDPKLADDPNRIRLTFINHPKTLISRILLNKYIHGE